MPKPSKARPAIPPRITHVQGLDPPPGLILYTDRLTLADELVPLVFPESDGNLPEGASLDHAGTRFDEFHLVVQPRAFFLMAETLRSAYLNPPYYGGTRAMAERALERRLRDQEESDKWWETFNPVLGMSPKKRLATPGWWKREGYFIWAGSDPHAGHSSVQWERLSEYDSVNDQVEYYLNRGLSLLDAIRASIAMDRVQIRAAALIAGGVDPIGMQLLERQMMLDDAQLHRAITNELSADLAEIEAALRDLPTGG